MLAEIIATTQHTINQATQNVSEGFQELVIAGEETRSLQELIVLEKDDAALWVAGFIYGYTGQMFDQIDYLVECSTQINGVDRKLARAYLRYGKDNYDHGHTPIKLAEAALRRSMRDCDETNELFEDIVSDAHQFFGQENWSEIVEANVTADENG